MLSTVGLLARIYDVYLVVCVPLPRKLEFSISPIAHFLNKTMRFGVKNREFWMLSLEKLIRIIPDNTEPAPLKFKEFQERRIMLKTVNGYATQDSLKVLLEALCTHL